MIDRDTQLRLLEESKEESRKTSDTILSLSTGALALSITFRSSLFGINPSWISLLAISWIGFIVTILCYVFNSIFKAKTSLDLAAGKSFEEVDPDLLKYSVVLRGTMLVSFLLAIVLLTTFGIKNIPQQSVPAYVAQGAPSAEP